MKDLDSDVDRVLTDGLASLVDSAVRYTAALARARGLSPTDVRAAGLVDRAHAMRPRELARALGISAGGTSGVIRRLVAAGLMHRDSGPANHRDVRLRVTSAGIEALRPAPAGQVATACDLLALGRSEREVIAGFVLQLTDLVERDCEAMRVARAHGRVRVPAPPRWG